MDALTSGSFFKAIIASSLFFPTKTDSTVLRCQKLYIKLVVGTVRISTSEKQNADYMTEKLNISRRSQVRVTHLSAIADHVTSTGHNFKWDHFDQGLEGGGLDPESRVNFS